MKNEEWYFRRGDKESGPFTSEVIREFARSGKLLPTDFLRVRGKNAYAQASRVPGVFPSPAAGPRAGSPPQHASVGSGPPPLPAGGGAHSALTQTSGLATASLVLGILSPFCSCITGIPGLILGFLVLRRIQQGERTGQPRLSGGGFAKAGIALSAGFMVMHALILPGLVLPAIQSAREAARRTSCSNNLKQILLGMLRYAEVNAKGSDGVFPTDIRDPDGKPLLSWRVAILPYIEQTQLYKKFRLTEPWDSPHNIKLLAEMPACYSCPSRQQENPAAMTSYIAVNGRGFFLDPQGKSRTFSDFTDGTSKSIAIVEIPPSMAVEWTKPDPPIGNPDVFLESASASHAGGLFGAGFADGHIESLPAGDIDKSLFRALLTIGAGDSTRDH